jgi:hypothetical protein
MRRKRMKRDKNAAWGEVCVVGGGNDRCDSREKIILSRSIAAKRIEMIDGRTRNCGNTREAREEFAE